MKSVVIVSRQSELARRQADIVAAKWRRAHPRCRIKIVGIKSRGDKIVDRALADIGGKDLFVKELEAEIDAGRADCAVHSLKDVGAVLPPRFALAAFLSAADSRDAVISNRNLPLANLPPGATVGTASPRRRALLAARHPRLRAVLMRGNVASRIAKMRRGDCDALLLAAAGLHRLGRGGDICEILDAERFPPAIGQGLLAIECAADRADVVAAARALDEPQAARRAAIGRALAAAMDADCHTALGARIRFENKRARVFAFYAPPRGGFVEAQIESEQDPANRRRAARGEVARAARGADRFAPRFADSSARQKRRARRGFAGARNRDADFAARRNRARRRAGCRRRARAGGDGADLDCRQRQRRRRVFRAQNRRAGDRHRRRRANGAGAFSFRNRRRRGRGRHRLVAANAAIAKRENPRANRRRHRRRIRKSRRFAAALRDLARSRGAGFRAAGVSPRDGREKRGAGGGVDSQSDNRRGGFLQRRIDANRFCGGAGGRLRGRFFALACLCFASANRRRRAQRRLSRHRRRARRFDKNGGSDCRLRRVNESRANCQSCTISALFFVFNCFAAVLSPSTHCH